MADYIYLLQNRLTQAQRHAVEAVRESARTRTMPVFLVGGAVRDLSGGAPVRDLDFAVQGDVAELVADLEQGGATVAGRNPVLASVYLLFPGGVRVEVGPTLTITYPKPGQPETQAAPILDDLRRRDFTANAMALSLNEGSYGLLLDPLNGIADMENHELRLVSPYGFIEQPALLLRAARLSTRLGWTFEQRTGTRYENAKEEDTISGLTGWERGYEAEELFHEEDTLSSFDHLTAEGLVAALDLSWSPAKADKDGMERVRDLAGQMEQIGIHPDLSPVLFPLLTAKLSPEELSKLKASFPRQGFVQQVDTLDARSKELAGQLTGKNAGAPSETWKMLFAAEPEVVLALASSSRSSAVQSKFKAFLNEWPPMRQRIPYALMQEMRITPETPGYEQLLQDLFFALIDGKLSTTEATRAFLEPYSPPAPVQQAAPRRRPAKATRSRSRKAAGKLVEPDADELDDLAEETSEAASPDIEASAGDSDSDGYTDKDLDTEEEEQEEPDTEAAVSADTVSQPRASAAEVVGISAKAGAKLSSKAAVKKGASEPAPVAADAKPATPINAAVSAKATIKSAIPTRPTPSSIIPKGSEADTDRTVEEIEKAGSKAAAKAVVPAAKEKTPAQQVVVIAKPQPPKSQPTKAAAAKSASPKTTPISTKAAPKDESPAVASKPSSAKPSVAKPSPAKSSPTQPSPTQPSPTQPSPAQPSSAKPGLAKTMPVKTPPAKARASGPVAPKAASSSATPDARPIVVVPAKAASGKDTLSGKPVKAAPTKDRSGR